MVNLQLSVEEIHRYIKDVELPLRQKGEMSLFAEEVIRYGSFVGSSIECYPNLPRAMDHGRRHINSLENRGKSVENGHLIVAESLTGPKGRFTRSWHAPPGGLWGCLIHANTLLPQSAMLLSLSVGVAACEAFRVVGIKDVFVRWVNDVLIRGGKAAGFLIESHTGPRWKEQFHLVGFGLNLNNRVFPPELENLATSLAEELGEDVDIKNFCLNFIAKLTWNIGLLYFVEAQRLEWQEGRLHPLIARWIELTDSLNRKVVFGNDVVLHPQYRATVQGIAPDGGLQMILEDGSTVTEHSGEIRYL